VKPKLPRFFYCEIFKENFWFFINWQEAEAFKYLEKHFNMDGVTLSNKDGLTIDFGNRKIIYINNKRKGSKFYSVLAHECIHAANMTFASRGLVSSSDELLAYYVETLMRKALE